MACCNLHEHIRVEEKFESLAFAEQQECWWVTAVDGMAPSSLACVSYLIWGSDKLPESKYL